MDCHLPFYGSSGSKRIASSAKPALSIIFFPLLYLFLHQWRPHCQHNKNIFAIFFDYQYFPLLFNLTEQLVTLCFDFAFYSYTSIVPRHYTVLYRWIIHIAVRELVVGYLYFLLSIVIALLSLEHDQMRDQAWTKWHPDVRKEGRWLTVTTTVVMDQRCA